MDRTEPNYYSVHKQTVTIVHPVGDKFTGATASEPSGYDRGKFCTKHKKLIYQYSKF